MGPKNELKKYGLSPSKRLGQHFLADFGVLKKVILAAELKKDDIILEIGPGTGILTKELAKTAKKVIAIEKDQKMCRVLKDLLKCWNVENVEIVQGDILKSNIQYLISNIHYKVVANLPYYITSPVIRKFLEAESPPELMVLMVQKEVAKRICASPPDMNLLAVSVQFYAKPKIIGYVSKKSFWPKPKVDSAIIKLTPINTNRSTDPHEFFKVAKAGFSQPRKQLINNLGQLFHDREKVDPKETREKIKQWLLKNAIQPEQRAESLSIDDWLELAKTFKNYL